MCDQTESQINGRTCSLCSWCMDFGSILFKRKCHAIQVQHVIIDFISLVNVIPVFCLGFFCRARRPAPFSWRPALLKKPKWRPALLTKKKKKNLNISHTWLLALLCPFCCPHSVDCAVHLLLSHSRALLVSSALFHPFTALIMPYSSPR